MVERYETNCCHKVRSAAGLLSSALMMSSGDGTLSVLDARSKKSEPFAQSEDQDDELLSLVAIKGYA